MTADDTVTSDPASWPLLLRRVAAIAGVQPALDLAAAYGGTPVYIPLPAKIIETHPLAVVMGLGAARAMAEELGGFGAVLEVPLGPRTPKVLRRVEVAKLTLEGVGQKAIARQLKCSVKTIRRDQYRLKAQRGAQVASSPPRQTELF